MSIDLIKSNWYEVKLSNSELKTQYIEFRNSENTKSFKEQFENSNFLRFKDKVYVWENIDFHGAKIDILEKGKDDSLLARIISESMLSQFIAEPKLYLSNSYGVIKITDYREDISNDDFPYLNTYRSYNLIFSPLKINNVLKYGFNITCSINHQITWGFDDFEANDLSREGLTELKDGKVRADTISIYKISNFFGDSSKLKESIDKLTEDSVQIACCTAFVEEFFNPENNDFKLPDECQILGINQFLLNPSTDIKEFGFQKLESPKNYFYRNSTPPEGTESYAMRSKIKYNKPTTYDNFENRDISIGVVFPKEHHLKISTFLKAVQEELCTIYKIPKSNFKYETFPIEDSNLQSYQSVFQNTRDINLAIVVVDEIHELLPIKESPYYFCKAEFIKRGINSQEVQIQQINKFITDQRSGYSNYADHTFSLNIYAKLGGTAWTVKPQGENRNELVIGVGATTDTDGKPQIGMTSIFRGDGKYLIGEVAAVTSIADYNKHLTDVLSKNLKECLDSKILDPSKPVYLVFHLFKKPGYYNEIEALKSLMQNFNYIDFKYSFVYVGDGHNFRFNKYQATQESRPFTLKDLPRGTFIKINDSLSFLALRKNSSRCCKIEIDPRSNVIDIEYLSKQVYDFSDLSHSSFNKQASPASIKYSKLMAQMSTKLRVIDGFYMSQISMPDNSPWFL
jgi:hypothetical protein